MSTPLITFLSDYGLEDDFVGVCHAVIAGLCPQARVIDLVHWVPRGDVRAGALMLRGALPFIPVGVHLAVVDPGVGSVRRGVALRVADGRLLVGPDNGLLAPAAALAGGVVEAVDLGASPFALSPISATFHGRDLFAPVAARLAGGAALGDAGTPLDTGSLVALELPRARVVDGVLVAHVLHVDRFGNVQLDVEGAFLLWRGPRLRGLGGFGACGVRSFRQDVRGRGRRRAAALRGRQSAAGGRGEPGGRGGAARARGRRRAPDPVGMTVAGGLGHPRLHFRVTDSTNARARELATRGAPHGTVVTAAEQSAGRGRQGRTWSAPAGRALLCSVVIRDPPRLLPLVAGVAVARASGRRRGSSGRTTCSSVV